MTSHEMMPAIVLAGGLGTRLRSVSGDVPKPLVSVAGRPFLEYVLDTLQGAGVRTVIMAVSHRWEAISAHFGAAYGDMSLAYSIEEQPLGTGGAILKCFREHHLERALVLNGDTLFRIDIAALVRAHRQRRPLVTMALRRVADASRYGIVSCNRKGRVEAFREKSGDAEPGLINGGIYVIERGAFEDCVPGGAFSFERDFLQVKAIRLRPLGVEYAGYFIDIGVPEDLRRARREFERDE
jgi:D-glycero-alpha-D-manno-heptose 1-phosphate guanylyltransferase